MSTEIEPYVRQGFGATLEAKAPVGLLIVDFVNGFADPAVFGGGNIAQAIERTVPLLATARARGWPIAHSRIVFADDGADHNVFTLKVPGMLTLKEHEMASAIVPALAPCEGELVVRKTACKPWQSRARSRAAVCVRVSSMRCHTASGLLSCRIASATGHSGHTKPTCSTWLRSTRRSCPVTKLCRFSWRLRSSAPVAVLSGRARSKEM